MNAQLSFPTFRKCLAPFFLSWGIGLADFQVVGDNLLENWAILTILGATSGRCCSHNLAVWSFKTKSQAAKSNQI